MKKIILGVLMCAVVGMIGNAPKEKIEVTRVLTESQGDVYLDEESKYIEYSNGDYEVIAIGEGDRYYMYYDYSKNSELYINDITIRDFIR